MAQLYSDRMMSDFTDGRKNHLLLDRRSSRTQAALE